MPHADFVHLHNHSQYSLLDGATRIPAMVERAAAYKMPALALTDHGNLYGAIEFYTACRAAGIVPIIKVPEMLPISLGGLGVREGATTYCLSRLGPSPAQAAAVALILRFFVWAHSALGGCAYALGIGKAGSRHARSTSGERP